MKTNETKSEQTFESANFGSLKECMDYLVEHGWRMGRRGSNWFNPQRPGWTRNIRQISRFNYRIVEVR